MIIFLVLFLKADTVFAFKLGENQTFNIDAAYDYDNRSNIKATLRQVGDRALYYVEDDWWNGLNPVDAAANNLAILNLLDEFDKTIHPRLTRVYGSEWSPGIDNELRVYILITPMKKNTGGYFNASDGFLRAQIASSNEREIIYLNSLHLNSFLMRGFLAHEFQHMISFYQKEKLRNLSEDIWLNEARSEYAPTLCGYDDIYEGSNLERRAKEFLRDPSDSLTEWRNQTADYGSINLFMQYLVGRYGEQILTKMMKADTVGIASVNQALKEMGFADNFAGVFTNWTVANYVNDCRLGDAQKYCYLSRQLTYERFHVSPTLSNALLIKEGTFFSYSDNTKDWAGHWYEILPADGSALNLILSFTGNNVSNFQVPFLIYHRSGIKLIRFLKFDARQSASDLILDFGGSATKMILIPFNQTKTSGFSGSEPVYPYSYTVKLTAVQSIPAPLATPLPASPLPSPSVSPTPQPVSPNYPDGSLIRAAGDYRVFVIRGIYKRWIQSPAILAAYPHLTWQNIIEVTPEERDWYQGAWLVRAEGDYRVYEINSDGTKHWLNMSAQQFSNSGRNWDLVFIVNKAEMDLYRTGAEALR
ncbi:MAG: hypothetical protein LiPW39_166 [Parcubacteria group bacterium LiPW_39]|nr:MAG: hypothetical protein LiPW39_166 [Parcubacteria group bacterium LiPW_39]